MPSIRKRKGPRGVRWHAEVRMAGHPPQRATFGTLEEARTWARGEEARIERVRKLAGARTLGDAIGRFLRTVLAERPPEARRTPLLILRWWHERHGDTPLSDLTPDLIAAARDAIRDKASGPTANRYLATLSAVLRRAYREWGWVSENSASRVERYRENPGRVRYLTPAEMERLLDACARTRRPELRVIVAVALTTGMRQGEILALKWADVDLARRTIVLHRTKNRERRGVPIPAALVADLRRLPRRLDSPFLFPAENTRSREQWPTYRKSWRAAVVDAKLADFRFHDTRHCAASYLAMNGATEREIAELLGHKTMAMVRRYSHLSPDHLASLVDRLANQVLPPSRDGQSS